MKYKMLPVGTLDKIRNDYNRADTDQWARDNGEDLLDGYETAKDALEAARLALAEGRATDAFNVIDKALATQTES